MSRVDKYFELTHLDDDNCDGRTARGDILVKISPSVNSRVRS